MCISSGTLIKPKNPDMFCFFMQRQYFTEIDFLNYGNSDYFNYGDYGILIRS